MAVAAFRSALSISRVSSSSSSASRIPDKAHRKRKKELDQMGAWDASWDASSTLPPPIREDLSIARGTIIPEMSVRGVGVCSSLGRRDYQEDRFSIKVSLLLQLTLYFTLHLDAYFKYHTFFRSPLTTFYSWLSGTDMVALNAPSFALPKLRSTFFAKSVSRCNLQSSKNSPCLQLFVKQSSS